MTDSEPIEVALEVISAFERLSVPYYIAGSLASSVYGIPRSTQDVDIVADIRAEHIKPLVDGLKDTFYIEEEAVKRTVQQKSMFNLIHLKLLHKVDVYQSKDEPFYIEQMKRRKERVIEAGKERKAFIASAEDTILSKLLWYQKGGGVSDRQWTDVKGMLKVQEGRLDMEYIKIWAKNTGIYGLLVKVLSEVKDQGS